MDNQQNQTNINWFPGHMAKTRRQITEDLKLVDIVVEILDARIPISSQNPEIKQILKSKKKIVILNKSDLADKNDNKKWLKHFEQNGIRTVLVDSQTGKGINQVIQEIKNLMSEEIKKQAEKGRTGRRIRVMIVGIPNVGKSSFINRISKRSTAEVGNRPGVTRSKQWIRVNNEIELLDTPGVLWPKFESQEVALNLAYIGTIKDDILEITEISYYLTKFLLKNYYKRLIERYSLNEEQVSEIMKQDKEENQNIYEIMQMIGRKRGAIISGGVVDDEKTAKIILNDFRNSKFGEITIEKIS
ncbi:MAG: ribosome biogenesis GTPase YlqF [Clostridia bacterium]|nr:ribosome biogenesis GTPase YlqF [Clostridia bacterium]